MGVADCIVSSQPSFWENWSLWHFLSFSWFFLNQPVPEVCQTIGLWAKEPWQSLYANDIPDDPNRKTENLLSCLEIDRYPENWWVVVGHVVELCFSTCWTMLKSRISMTIWSRLSMLPCGRCGRWWSMVFVLEIEWWTGDRWMFFFEKQGENNMDTHYSNYFRSIDDD